MTVCEMNIFQTLSFMYLCKNGKTTSIFKHIYALKQLRNTQQDLKMYCSNYYIRETLQNLSEAIVDHSYRVILLPQIMTY